MFANPVSSASRTYKHRPPSPSRSHRQLIPSSNHPNSSRRPPCPSNYGSSAIPFPPPGAYPRRYPSMNDSRFYSRPQSPSSNTPRFSNDTTFARFTSPSGPAPPASLEAIDPFSLFDGLLAEQKESRDSRTGFDAMERMLFTGGSERDWRVGQDYPSYRKVPRAVGGRRKMSASWNEGERRKNGEWNVRLDIPPFEATQPTTFQRMLIDPIALTDEDGLPASRGNGRRNNQIFEQFDQSLFRRFWFYGEFGLIKYFHSYLY